MVAVDVGLWIDTGEGVCLSGAADPGVVTVIIAELTSDDEPGVPTKSLGIKPKGCSTSVAISIGSNFPDEGITIGLVGLTRSRQVVFAKLFCEGANRSQSLADIKNEGSGSDL